MRKGKTYILVIALLVAVIALAGVLAACGEDEPAAEESAPATEAPAIEGTALERATAILGQEPTGLALDIVTKGEVVVANDANYAPQSYLDPDTNEIIGFDVDVAKGMAEILGLDHQVGAPRVGDHPGWPEQRSLRRLDRLDDHHA